MIRSENCLVRSFRSCSSFIILPFQFQEDEAEAESFRTGTIVFRGVHVPAHFVRGGPELGFKVEGGTVADGFLLKSCLCHADCPHRKSQQILGKRGPGQLEPGYETNIIERLRMAVDEDLR